MKMGVGAMDNGNKLRHSSSNAMEQSSVNEDGELPKINKSDVSKFASTYSQILSTCRDSKKALRKWLR